MKKKNSFGEITGLFRNVEFNKMNSKILMTSLSAISVLSSCGDDVDGKGSEDDKTQATQYGQFHKDHRKLVNVLKDAFKNKKYAKATGDRAVEAYINSLSKEQLENLSKYSPIKLKTELENLKNENEDDFEIRFKESLSKPSNEKNDVQNSELKQSYIKEDEAKKKEEENKKLLGDVEKILNNLSEGNESAKGKFIGYFKFLSEIEEQSIEKSFIDNYNKSTGNNEEEKVISCLKQTLNNVFSKEFLNKLSSKVVKHVQSSINDNDATKNKVNVKADSVKKDNNIETYILYSEKSNDKNVLNDNKQFYVIEEVEVKNSKTNNHEKVKIVVENSNEDDTLEKYVLPDLNKLVIDRKEKLKEVINSYGDKLIEDKPVNVSTFTGLGIKELFTRINDFYKKLIEGKDSEDKMILDNFDKTQWAQVFDKEENFKKFIITELVGIIKKYYNDLPVGTEKDQLDTCSKIFFSGEVLNYCEDTSKNFVNLKDFYNSIDKTKTYDVSQYKIKPDKIKPEKQWSNDDYEKGKYQAMYVARSENAKTAPTILDKEMGAITDNPSNASLFCLFNCELNKQYCEVFGSQITAGGIVISTTGESDGVNPGDNKCFIASVFEDFRQLENGTKNYVENKKYDGINKYFREGMDEALDASFKSLQLVQDKGNAKNLKTLFFKYLDQITPQQMDSITDDSFVKWMNQNNIYLSIKSMNLDCIKMFCDTFFKNFFGGKKEVKTFMKAIEDETKVSGFDKKDKDKVNTSIGKIETSQEEYLNSLKNGAYTQYWYKLLENEILKKMS